MNVVKVVEVSYDILGIGLIVIYTQHRHSKFINSMSKFMNVELQCFSTYFKPYIFEYTKKSYR